MSELVKKTLLSPEFPDGSTLRDALLLTVLCLSPDKFPKAGRKGSKAPAPGHPSQTAPWTDGEHNILSGRKRVPSPGAFVMFADQSLATAYKYSGVMDLRFS